MAAGSTHALPTRTLMGMGGVCPGVRYADLADQLCMGTHWVPVADAYITVVPGAPLVRRRFVLDNTPPRTGWSRHPEGGAYGGKEYRA